MDISITCPRCGREFEVREPGGALSGLFQFPCPGGHYVAVRLPLESAGGGGGWGVRVGGARRLALADGTYTLGRESRDRPSDIAVPASDKQASRRCAELTISGAVALLRVVKTVNPLRGPGGVELGDGSELRLPAVGTTTVVVGTTEVVFDYSK